jgi:hypothetical protein
MSILSAETRRKGVIALGVGWLMFATIVLASACMHG